MALRRDPLDPSCFYASHDLSARLAKLYRHDCPASFQFKAMALEVKTFHASYQIIRPFLQPPRVLLSAVCVEMVQSIHEGAMAICESLAHDVRRLRDELHQGSRASQRRVNAFFFLHQGKPTISDRNKRIKRFFESKNNYELERQQLWYFCMLLSLILAVLGYSQHIHDGAPESFIDTSSFLIGDLHSALADLRLKEVEERERRRVHFLPVQASRLWEGFPVNPQEDNVSPLRRLTYTWVNPEAVWAAHPSPDVQAAQEVIYQWRQRNEELQIDLGQLNARLQGLEIENADLTAENDRLKAGQAEAYDTRRGLENMISDIQNSVRDLKNQLVNEKRERYKQEQREDRLRSQKTQLERQLHETSAELQGAEARTRKVMGDLKEVSKDYEDFRRQQSVTNGRQRGRRPPPSSTHGFGTELPPVSFDTRGYSNNRPSSTRRSSRSSRETNAERSTEWRSRPLPPPESPRPPPVPRHTRPFRVELDGNG